MLLRFALGLALAALPAFAVAGAGTAASYEKTADSVVLPVPEGWLRLQVCTPDIVRVTCAPDRAFFAHQGAMIDPARKPVATEWSVAEEPKALVLKTASLRVRVDTATGAVAFADAAGRPITSEVVGGRTLAPAEVQGQKVLQVRQRWQAQADESLYGLGNHQLGLLDIKGHDIDLWQHNTSVAVPFLLSSRGYGLLWDNAAYTRFGDTREFEPMPAAQLLDASGRPGGLTVRYFAGADFTKQKAEATVPAVDIVAPPRDEHQQLAKIPDGVDKDEVYNTYVHPSLKVTGPISVRWEGSIVPQESGEFLFQSFSNGDVKIWVDGRPIATHWRQGWLAGLDQAKVRLEAGRRHSLRVDWVRSEDSPTVQLRWKTPAPSADTSLWSEVGDGIDYYFIHGAKPDAVIAGYRWLTGPARLMPKWSFGLWQSRQRYMTAQQSLDIVDGFRSRKIPFDVIVQDWFYWNADGWGSHEFDPERFPDPAGWIRGIHERNARLMISVWPKFYRTTRTFEEMQARGFLFQPNLDEQVNDWLGHNYTFYDAFNPAARELFWKQVDRELFSKKVDAWWLDGSEPDVLPVPTLDGNRKYSMPTAAGISARELNAYPMLNASAVYDGQRTTKPDQRVFILTRSGFAGQQRYAGAVWSGDITSTWTAFAKQIPAGLGFSLSGLPYWTMDSGGFAVPARFNAAEVSPADREEWAELNTRWLQYAAFVPIMRVHGELPFREMWEFGGEKSPAYAAQLKTDRLRYRLLPYIYSVAGAVTHDGASFMRPLVLDFPDAAALRGITDEYIFGPSLLVSPVTTYRARSRTVQLPAVPGGWYEFWTGKSVGGGKAVDTPAPYDEMPLHVRAGAILPVGPELQYADEKPADPLTLRVYAGADGDFTLYEDDGASYGYERGEFTRIPLHWDDAKQTLTIGARTGAFPGMLAERTIHIVVTQPGKPVAFAFDAAPDRTVRYDGKPLAVKLAP